MGYKKYNFNAVFEQNLTIWPDNSVKNGWSSVITSARDIYGKTAYCGSSRGELHYDFFSRVRSVIIPDQYPTIFISSESKISRDVLRNGGYKITYNKDKADAIVIPALKNYAIRQCNIVAFRDGSMRIFNIRRKNYDESIFTTEERDAVLTHIKDMFGYEPHELQYRADLGQMVVSFLQKCEEYEDLLINYRYNLNFVQDKNVAYNTKVEMTPESMLVWRNLANQDIRLFEKAILASDWSKYPMTTCLYIYHDITSNEYRFSGQGRVMLDAINFDLYSRGKSLGDQVIDPEDWNLFQAYIMLRAGLSNNGGYLEGRRDDLGSCGEFVRHRMAVAPLKISEQKTFKNLINEIRNS